MLRKYLRGIAFSFVSIPIWIVLAYLLSRLTPDPLSWKGSALLGIFIGLGLVVATLRFGHRFRNDGDLAN